MKTMIVLCLFVAQISFIAKVSYSQAAAGTQPTIAAVLDQQFTVVEHQIVSAAEVMPEEKYFFSPAAGEFNGVRTFAQQLRHVAYANHLFFGAILGQTAQSGPERNGPESIKTKEQILRYLRDSFALGHKAIAAITLENEVALLDKPTVPAFNTRLGIINHMCAHAYDHYGQIVEYLRMNGIVPPGSQPPR